MSSWCSAGTPLAFAGALAGLAGALYVFSKGSAFPDYMSIPLLLRRADHGPARRRQDAARADRRRQSPSPGCRTEIARFEYWRLFLGLVIILIVIAFPQGIAGFLPARHIGPPSASGSPSEEAH